MRSLIFSLSLLLALPSLAAEVEDAPPPMPAEKAAAKGEQPIPDIRIIERGDATLTEYRIHGRLYQIKVVPVVGQPYFLVDPAGQGNFVRQSGPTENIAVPRWVLFSW